MTKIAVIGAGSWGTTFAKVIADGGRDVVLWGRRQDVVDEINNQHRNGDYLPGVNLPANLRADSTIAAVLKEAEMVFLSVPSQSLRGNLSEWGALIRPDAILVSLMKGVEKFDPRKGAKLSTYAGLWIKQQQVGGSAHVQVASRQAQCLRRAAT